MLNIYVVFQSWEDVVVWPAHDGALRNQCQHRPETDSVQLARKDVRQHDNGNRWDVTRPLGNDGGPL